MKTIIMAGGEGSRLRPLTCGRPKPMVPVLNKPIMSHIVTLLKKHGMRDIGVTLQYMPDSIKDYFGKGEEHGVNFKYFIEDVPLGTAGSVKNAQNFLDETFIVISGDALTDLDLTRAVQFHREKGAVATLVLTRVDNPLEYGVVITNENGYVQRFLEKPGWGEVFSDTVNTGIYVLEPEVLDYFEPGRMFDFSKDLFPLLLREGRPVYGVVLPGYWCDIGNLNQYWEAHHDILKGNVQVELPGEEIAPGIRVENDTEIHPSARIQAPALIGGGTKIGEGVSIEPYTIIGGNCTISDKVSIKRSVLWNNVNIGPATSLRGTVIGSRVQVQANAGIYEGSVVGSDCRVKERSIIKPGIKLWPHKTVEAGSIVQDSIVWGTRQPKKLFGVEGASGEINTDLTPEFTAKLAAAYASILGKDARVGVSCDTYSISGMFKKAVISGLQSSGAEVYDLGTGITPLHRYAVRTHNYAAGVHIKMSSRRAGAINIILTNEKGSNISRTKERKVENVLAREDFRRSGAGSIKSDRFVAGVFESYIKSVTSGLKVDEIRRKEYKVVMACDSSNLGNYVKSLARELNLSLVSENIATRSKPGTWPEYQEALPAFAGRVVEEKAALGAVLDHNADRLILVDEKGEVIQEDLLTALLALIVLKGKNEPVVVPVTAPNTIETLAREYSAKVIRTKTAVQDFSEQLINADAFSQFLMNFDALSAFCSVLEFMAGENTVLTALRDEIPAFFMDKKDVQVPWETKGRVIRRLIEERPAEELELLDGVKAFHPNGWTLVLPDPEEPVCRIFSEGVTMEVAESLADFYSDKINNIIGEGKAG